MQTVKALWFFSSRKCRHFSDDPWPFPPRVPILKLSPSICFLPHAHDFGSRPWVSLFGLIYRWGSRRPLPRETRRSLPFNARFARRRFHHPWKYVTGTRRQPVGIYSYPQPKDGRTYLVKNKDGLPLPTAFTGEPASAFLIDAKEQEKRMARMRRMWLFYGNSARFASAMMGNNHAAFHYGWWKPKHEPSGHG
jgi:hypothetical protein